MGNGTEHATQLSPHAFSTTVVPPQPEQTPPAAAALPRLKATKRVGVARLYYSGTYVHDC